MPSLLPDLFRSFLFAVSVLDTSDIDAVAADMVVTHSRLSESSSGCA